MQRNSEEAAAAILESMKWLGLEWDAGPIYQSRRFDVYRGYADVLMAAGKAYMCFCSQQRLERMRADQTSAGSDPKYDRACAGISLEDAKKRAAAGEKFVVRFKMPEGENIVFNDMVHDEVAFNSSTLDDFVIIKSDGTPTYNFAVAIDDHDMGITHVLRGDDHISNTPKQIQILKALGFKIPAYGHVPMILGADKAKLSKRHGATSLTWYQEAGYIREGVNNYLALLGWSFDGSSEFFTLSDLAEKFSVERINSTPAVFDIVRLEHFNAHHLKNMDIEEKTSLMISYVKRYMPDLKYDAALFNRERVRGILLALGDRLKKLSDFALYAAPFINAEISYADEVINKTKKDFPREAFIEGIDGLAEILEKSEPFTAENLEAILREGRIKNLNFSKSVSIIRSALTGQNVSPGIFDVILLTGRESSVNRIKNYKRVMSATYEK